MNDADGFKLLFGPYRTPRVRLGTVLTCESRDCDVIVVDFTDAKIPWPVGRRRGSASRGPVVYGQLADAARRKMSEAQRRRGTWPPEAGEPWTEAEDQLIMQLPTAEAAERTGRTLQAVYERRRELEVPDGRGFWPPPPR